MLGTTGWAAFSVFVSPYYCHLDSGRFAGSRGIHARRAGASATSVGAGALLSKRRKRDEPRRTRAMRRRDRTAPRGRFVGRRPGASPEESARGGLKFPPDAAAVLPAKGAKVVHSSRRVRRFEVRSSLSSASPISSSTSPRICARKMIIRGTAPARTWPAVRSTASLRGSLRACDSLRPLRGYRPQRAVPLATSRAVGTARRFVLKDVLIQAPSIK